MGGKLIRFFQNNNRIGRTMSLSGPALALVSALLFGLSPALAKHFAGETSAPSLAGLLYLGSGLGLIGVLVFRKNSLLGNLQRLSSRERAKVFGAILSGGVLAPLCFAYGIKAASAFEVSLLLNLETVASTIIAWLVFHEHVDPRVWGGKVLVLIGALILSIDPNSPMVFSLPALIVVAACMLWGIDNNLTRDVDNLSPTEFACLKGIVAGVTNISIGLLFFSVPNRISSVVALLVIGAFSFGVSLVLFIQALRQMGTARTATYFATAPFFGMIAAMLFLRETMQFSEWIAAALMALGVWVLRREHHEHCHTHEAMTHSHRHVHDEHHQHVHDGTEGPEPHSHIHTHEPMTHSHPHWPDIHHRHSH
jgi:drug/metabolite transporter (DMT)-like permease